MIGFLINLCKAITPMFYLGIMFSPIVFKDYLFKKSNEVTDNIVFIKVIKRTNNPFNNDIEKVVILSKDNRIVYNNSEVSELADFIFNAISEKKYIATFTDRSYFALKHHLKNYLSFDKKSIRNINIYNAYMYSYKDNIPIEWKKTINDYKEILECILYDNNNDIELLHNLSL